MWLLAPDLDLDQIVIVSDTGHCTAGDEGAVADVSCMSIFSACFGLPTSVQLAATTWSGQIWISGIILPHFDVRTISVASKLKELQIFLHY